MIKPYNQIYNWPNVLTFLRILLLPLLVLFYYLPFWWAHLSASVIFILASMTDWLDGYLARSLKQTTPLGAFLDPVADKLIVCIALLLIVAEPTFRLIHLGSSTLTIPAPLLTLPVAIIISREIIVSALREWMAELGKRSSVAVSRLGKFKTCLQMLALIVLLFCDVKTPAILILLGYILLYGAVLLTLWSMLLYLKAAWIQINDL